MWASRQAARHHLLATVVTVVATLQAVEDSQILRALKDALSSARQAPDIHAMSLDEGQAGILMGTFMAQTLPDYRAQRLAAEPVAPTAPVPGDPLFDVNGLAQAIIETRGSDGQFRQTFMSGGWFVTRTRLKVTDAFGPWQWSLQPEIPPTQCSRIVRWGSKPGGFLDINYTNPTDESAAVKTQQFETVVLPGTTPAIVTWTGNHAPVLSPTAATSPLVNTPVALSAGPPIRWRPDDDSMVRRESSLRRAPSRPLLMDFRPTPSDPNAPACPWPALDAGNEITATFVHAGLYKSSSWHETAKKRFLAALFRQGRRRRARADTDATRFSDHGGPVGVGGWHAGLSPAPRRVLWLADCSSSTGATARSPVGTIPAA